MSMGSSLAREIYLDEDWGWGEEAAHVVLVFSAVDTLAFPCSRYLHVLTAPRNTGVPFFGEPAVWVRIFIGDENMGSPYVL